ncbi:helix-turn-helix domain-containing protein [Limnohabitans sp.]|uniref:helix-turn-helix domain-containing protein n=1 Tax=Limnohabitans sp. TaxID=1907725 RepID=UPI00262626D4|nr:helix-turn-helix domain-containing protein [Limnohabitans sp.]
MKNDKLSPIYFSTSEVAKYLGLSVGTVQRMVETGIFKAFVTQGGHRRILATSLNQFCQAQGVASPQVPAAAAMICILHASDKITSTLTQLSQWAEVKVITQPLDLMGIQRPIGALFIDARIPWVHDAPMHLQETTARDAHIIVYNSIAMPAGSALQSATHMSLVPGDISPDLVFGYLLGTTEHHPHQTQSLPPIDTCPEPPAQAAQLQSPAKQLTS